MILQYKTCVIPTELSTRFKSSELAEMAEMSDTKWLMQKYQSMLSEVSDMFLYYYSKGNNTEHE
jgi:hypothetical protein